jgi:UDP-2,3-diacylglucosamine hydrolase
MHSIFISDLHLSPARPHISDLFLRFLRETALGAEKLYILGDLFDYWAGDDDTDSFNTAAVSALRSLTDAGTALYVMHGNRDFLLGAAFAETTQATLLPDSQLVDLYGTRTLVMHGDTLCTDDIKYQEFRRKVRNPAYQGQFLAQPLAGRKQIIAGLISENSEEKQLKTEAIMDVALSTVESVLRENGYPRLIHGHTHRPARHVHLVDGHACERWVLADWYERGQYLQVDAAGCRSVTLEAPGAAR